MAIKKGGSIFFIPVAFIFGVQILQILLFFGCLLKGDFSRWKFWGSPGNLLGFPDFLSGISRFVSGLPRIGSGLLQVNIWGLPGDDSGASTEGKK